MMSNKTVCALLAAAVALVLVSSGLGAHADESQVLVLDEGNFDDHVAANEILLVEFYAPWCGHCKKLEPEYDAAAAALAADGLKIAKVDADQADNKALAQKYGIRGFPTLKLFRDGAFSADYEGQRTKDAIISFMRKQNEPAVSVLADQDAVNAFVEKSTPVAVVAYFAAAEGDEFDAFTAAANTLRNDFSFGYIVGNQAAATAAVKDAQLPVVVLHKSFDDGNVAFGGDKTSQEELAAFVKAQSTPLVDEIGPNNYKKYADSGLPLAYIFVAKSDEAQVKEFTERFHSLAKSSKGKLNWVWIDSVQYARHGERLGLDGVTFPAIAIENMDEGHAHFAYPKDAELTFEPVNTWVQSFLSGELAPTVKSEAEPSEEEIAAEAVKKIVAKTFDRDVIQSEADVFVEFYAPWCGHCKKLTPTWESIAQAIKKQGDSDKVVIAKIDATANDVDGKYGVRGFPTLKYFKAGSKATPIDYSGDRSEADLIKFIKETSTAGVSVAVSAEGESHDEL